MASFVPICDICMTDNITKLASVWCSECEEAICNECERQHGRMGLSKNHKTIPIKDYQKLPSCISAIEQKCMRHNLKFDFYCVIHNEPCCVSCIIEKHGTCQKLKPLSEVVGGVKSSAAFADLADRAKDISELICNLITEKQNDRASLGVQKNKIISEVQNIRAAINCHLLKLEKDLLDKLDNMEKKQNENIESFIQKLSEMRRKVENITVDLENTKQHASNFQAFLGIHEWNKIIEIEEKDWMSLQTDQIKNTFDIHIEFSPILLKLEKDVKELGKLEVKSSSSKKILLKKEKQGQVFVPVSSTVDNMQLTKHRFFQIPDGPSKDIRISGIDMFNDGRIVLADHNKLNKRLVIMNEKVEFIKTIQLEDTCYDVVVIDKDTIATTLDLKKRFVIVDVKSSKVQRSIPTHYKCYGIYYTGTQFIVSMSNKTIQFFDFSGNILTAFEKADISSYCSGFGGTLYYTAYTNDSVYSTKLNGDVRWKFDCQRSAYPAGITNDALGNIFIICCHSNELLVLKEDGMKSRVLLTKENGLNGASAIHFNRNSNTLIVCNVSGECFLYKVT